jgi:hypothetical protein
MHLVLIGDTGKELGRYPVPLGPGKLVMNTTAHLKITVERFDPANPANIQVPLPKDKP